jgi:hypothetical protein
MRYSKPGITVLGSAVAVVKGSKQQHMPSDSTPGYKTVAAYEADE